MLVASALISRQLRYLIIWFLSSSPLLFYCSKGSGNHPSNTSRFEVHLLILLKSRQVCNWSESMKLRFAPSNHLVGIGVKSPWHMIDCRTISRQWSWITELARCMNLAIFNPYQCDIDWKFLLFHLDLGNSSRGRSPYGACSNRSVELRTVASIDMKTYNTMQSVKYIYTMHHRLTIIWKQGDSAFTLLRNPVLGPCSSRYMCLSKPPWPLLQ